MILYTLTTFFSLTIVHGKISTNRVAACNVLCGPPSSPSGTFYFATVKTPQRVRSGIFSTFGSGRRRPNVCACPRVLELNCGKDGKTYINHCQRTCEGVALAFPGQCRKRLGNGLQGSGSRKVCSCPKISEPNCGVDGITYANGCLRNCLGVLLAYTGACKEIGNSTVEPSSNSTSPDDKCSCTKIYEPNCGTDGKSYANNCLRQCAGVKLAKEGPCKSDQGGTNATAPGLGLSGRTLEVADEVCACPKIYEPNCGVDGKTYENYCLRQCKGIPLAYGTACETQGN